MSRLSTFLRRVRYMRATIPRKVSGFHNDRLDGISDLLTRARDASVLDVGCYRGMISLEFANNGATLVHGCDVFPEGVTTARQIFSDIPVASRFEIVDLTGGPAAMRAAFGADLGQYDIVLFLGVHHHLKKVMAPADLDALVTDLAGRAKKFLAYRTRDFAHVDTLLTAAGLTKVQHSTISRNTGAAAIFERR